MVWYLSKEKIDILAHGEVSSIYVTPVERVGFAVDLNKQT